MEYRQKSLTATNLAVHHHLNCDLYLHNVYHQKKPQTASPAFNRPLTESHYKRGLQWEETLYSWLDNNNLLLKVPSRPLEADVLVENILADDREHYYIAGLTFMPPQHQLRKRFARRGVDPVAFGLGKPDLLEIRRTPAGLTWTVIDAKASNSIKTSHHVQIYFYTLCLQEILTGPFYTSTGEAGIWLPPEDGFNIAEPCFDDIKMIKMSLLSPSLDTFLFERLPKMLALPEDQVKAHFNPLCSGCNYRTQCKTIALQEGRLGSMPNISISDARTLQEFLNLGERIIPGFVRNPPADIEDLHLLVSKDSRISALEKHSPITMKKVAGTLALTKRGNRLAQGQSRSPVLDAVRSDRVKVIPRRNFSCPFREDVAIVMSLIQDPAKPKPSLEFFSLAVFFDGESQPSFTSNGQNEEFVPTLAATIRNVTSGLQKSPSAQFYVWSAGEQVLLQSHLIKAALLSDAARTDIRLCIGALAQGSSLLQTTFQPVLLSGSLLSFLGKGKRTKAEYQACLERMGVDTQGSVPELRARVIQELERLQGLGSGHGQQESGQIHPLVNLKKEVSRLLALPIAGYWDLRECFEAILPQADPTDIASDDQLLSAYRRDDEMGRLRHLLAVRDQSIYSVLVAMRRRVQSGNSKVLVNEGKPLAGDFMDICRQDHLSKLFFMQQFEVFSKLNELWTSRIDGCPESPVLEYRYSEPGTRGMEHVFRLVSGAIDVASSDSDHSFFNKLLVEDTTSDTEIPVECLFDDLAIAGFVIPLNKWTKPQWECQDRRVREQLRLADIRNVYASDNQTMVVLRTWDTTNQQPIPGTRYRLSPRLVDFNTTKVLATLFEIDWQWGEREDTDHYHPEEDHRGIPFLQLVMDPKSFGVVDNAKDIIRIETGIQRVFRNLKDLDVEAAGSLFLKPSQHRATQRILSNRLAVIWGPPGTGKTHTIALSLLRLLEVQWRQQDQSTKIIFITAMTHAAIDACLGKLERLVESYRSITALSSEWLDKVKIQRVLKGNDHLGPSRSGGFAHIYAGTVYQLYNFSKAHDFEVDCVVADEAGQIALASLALVLRSLSAHGRIIVAGDSEQLAPIFTGNYPRLKDLSLFGSVLDSLMFTPAGTTAPVTGDSQQTNEDNILTSPNTIVQLTENFRLNPDLGEFVSTIYSRRFKPQKTQVKWLSLVLQELGQVEVKEGGLGVYKAVFDKVRNFLLGLSKVMLRVPQATLRAPRYRAGGPIATEKGKPDNSSFDHSTISLSLIRLKTWSAKSDQFGYETHVHGEAAIAAALIACIRYCAPEDDIFVATPHRVQREAVKSALERLSPLQRPRGPLERDLDNLDITRDSGSITVDTIERLQGSEASFVICLFSLPESHTNDLGFFLERRRLNVAISRTKTLCVLVASSQVLCPPVTVFANEQTAKGFAFLKAFEDRAWSCDISVNIDKL